MNAIDNQILNLIKIRNPNNPLKYVNNLIQEYSINKLNKNILECKDCSICNTQHSLFYGNPNATVMFIGDYIIHDNTNHPFNNECLTILNNVFEKLNINTEELCFINSVNCCPHKIINNIKIDRPPTKKEVDNCSVYLKHAINIVKPRVIIILGNIGFNIFQKGSIKNNRGKMFQIDGIPTIATYNPQYFIGIKNILDEELFYLESWDFYNDIEKAINYLKDIFPDNIVIKEDIDEN